MQKWIRLWMVLAVLLGIAALYRSAQMKVTNEKATAGAVLTLEDGWQTDDMESGSELRYECQIPTDSESGRYVLYIQSYWLNYQVEAEGKAVYVHTLDMVDGYTHLITLPGGLAGKSLTVRFTGIDAQNMVSVRQSDMYLGDRSDIYSMILQESLYALLFLVLAVLMGTFTITLGIFLRKKLNREMDRGLISLGLFILCAGLWIVTDSKLLLLVTEKTSGISLISFLAFLLMPLPLLQFTRRMLGGHERGFGVLSGLYMLIFLFYAGNYCLNLISGIVLIFTEHLLSVGTMFLILWYGIGEMRREKDWKILLVVFGYVIFCVGSVLALLLFYLGNFTAYSIAYALGILGFIFCLTASAATELYQQIQENANLAVYTRLAYRDLMTGMGNRTAFMEEQEKDAGFDGPVAYLMMDANDLKKVNDTFGHHAGDRLLILVSECIRQAVGELGKCYRIGGDEFVVSFKSVTQAQVQECQERVQKEAAAKSQEQQFPVSIAAGFAWAGSGKKNLE